MRFKIEMQKRLKKAIERCLAPPTGRYPNVLDEREVIPWIIMK